MAKATALDKVRRVRQPPKPKSQSAQIGPDGPKHPGNRQLYDKRGRPDAGARLYSDYPNPKVATFCAALWLTFTLPLTPASTRAPSRTYSVASPPSSRIETQALQVSALADWQVLGLLLYLGLAPTALGYLAYCSGTARCRSANVGLIATMVEPAIAAVLA